MSVVIIGIDPHKASRTAVAVDQNEATLGQIKVRSRVGQTEQLLGWAAPWSERVWAIEGPGGLGYLLSQQVVNAGETVLDVQPKLAAKVRLLDNGSTNKNDPNDARSVAVAALEPGGFLWCAVRTWCPEGSRARFPLQRLSESSTSSDPKMR